MRRDEGGDQRHQDYQRQGRAAREIDVPPIDDPGDGFEGGGPFPQVAEVGTRGYRDRLTPSEPET